ncbi:ABC transporter ATP-binding protein [Nonomuraea sp. NPDC005650]|uniref:ABC transporter ATP-binding protein n=1 Tax=Nonomuraea sp. NPDC005650 TaxID=3157045 RepID=UPI0033A1ECFD
MNHLALSDPIRENKATVGLLVALAMAQWGAEALIPWSLGRILATLIDPASGGLIGSIALLAALAAVTIAASITRYVVAAKLRIRVSFDLKARLGDRVTRGAQGSTGELGTSVNSDTDAIGGFPNAIARLLGSIAAMAVIATYLLAESLPLGGAVLLGVVLVSLLTTRIAVPLEGRQRAHRKLLGTLNELGVDLAGGLRMLRGLGAQAAFEEHYRVVSKQTLRAGVAVGGTQALLSASAVFLPNLLLILVTWAGGRLALSGEIEPGTLVAFCAAAVFLVGPVGSVADFVTTRAGASVATENYNACLGGPDREQPRAAEPGLLSGDLTAPRTGTVVRPGELVVVIPGSPADETRIAQHLAGLRADDPDWRASIGGTVLAEAPRSDVRGTVLHHGAQPFLFSGTIREAVDPAGGLSDDEVLEALRAAGCDDLLTLSPEGLDLAVGPRARNLSGGQRQRLALASALARQSPYLVMVRPTEALDSATEQEVASRLRSFRQKLGTVVLTRSPAFLELADRVLYLERDLVSGTHRQLLTTCETYRAVVTQETQDA